MGIELKRTEGKRERRIVFISSRGHRRDRVGQRNRYGGCADFTERFSWAMAQTLQRSLPPSLSKEESGGNLMKVSEYTTHFEFTRYA